MTSKFLNKKATQQYSSDKENDMTLNDKINKVISDIKRINEQKAKEFGCNLNNTSNFSSQSCKNKTFERKEEKLVDYIKKENKKDQQKKDRDQYQSLLPPAAQQTNPSQSNNYQSNQSQKNIEDEELSSLFDLTSAKRVQGLPKINEMQKKYISSQTSSPPKQKIQTYETETQMQTQQRRSIDKYEDILAAPGSILILNNGAILGKRTIIDELMSSQRTQTEYETQRTVQTQEDPKKDEEIEKWRIINQRTEEMLSKERERNLQLQEEIQKNNNEKEFINEILEDQEIKNQIQDRQLKRLTSKTATLQKHLIRETVLKENMKERTGYSNPAKLMNFIKMKKCQNDKVYLDTNHYVSHIEAYSKLSIKQSEEERLKQKQILQQISTKMTASLPRESQVVKQQTRIDNEANMRKQVNKSLQKQNEPVYYDDKVQIEDQDIPRKKFLGMDYFRLIYICASILAFLMIFVYITVEDEKIKRMTLVQGSLSIFLIFALSWYHSRVEENSKKDKLKKKQDALLKKN